jgi:CheY-like chemotaxis protein
VKSFEQLDQILLVDDNPMDLLIHTRLLQRMHICKQVYTLTSGREALDYLEVCAEKRTLPELLLLDVDMPLMNGFQFLQQWEGKHLPGRQGVRIVLLTSSIANRDRQQGQLYRLHGYLQKPLTPEKLLALLS